MPYIINICIKLLPISTRPFILENKEVRSKKGTTQGDPTAMVAYTLGVTLLIHFLYKYISMNNNRCKEKPLVDDFTIVGKIEGIRSYWELLQQVVQLYGYFPKPAKSYFIYFSLAFIAFSLNHWKMSLALTSSF